MVLIAEQGMSNVTISAVAERAGVSRQTVYNHFTDIDSIILAVHERHDVMAQTGTLLGTAATAPEKIELLIRHTVGAYTHTGAAAALVHGLGPGAQERLRRHAEEGRDLIASILEEGMAAKVFRDDLDPKLDARLIQGTLTAAGEAAAEAGADLPRITAAATRSILGTLASLNA